MRNGSTLIHSMLNSHEIPPDMRVQCNGTHICQSDGGIMVREPSPLRCDAKTQEGKTGDQAEYRSYLAAVSGFRRLPQRTKTYPQPPSAIISRGCTEPMISEHCRSRSVLEILNEKLSQISSDSAKDIESDNRSECAFAKAVAKIECVS